MHTAILVERGTEPIALRMKALDNFVNFAPPPNAQDRTSKSFKRIHTLEKNEDEKVAIYFRPDVGLKEADAKQIGMNEADKFINPQKYKDERTELERLRQENTQLRSQLAASAVK